MEDRNAGLIADTVFVAVTRPPMRFGVTYIAMLMNLVFTMEAFLLTKNLVTLLLAVPIHGVCALLCARDPRYFDLLLLWAKTRLLGHVSSLRFWRGASYSPLVLDLPDIVGRRRAKGLVLPVRVGTRVSRGRRT
jgi:type IV secretion system protein VirB3